MARPMNDGEGDAEKRLGEVLESMFARAKEHLRAGTLRVSRIPRLIEIEPVNGYRRRVRGEGETFVLRLGPGAGLAAEERERDMAAERGYDSEPDIAADFGNPAVFTRED